MYNGKHLIYTRKCAQCGKLFMVFDPEIWVYRRDTFFYCTWKCLRASEKKKELDAMNKVTLQQKKKAVRIGIEDGENKAIEYLAHCGSKAPKQMWMAIVKNLAKADPEAYMKLTEPVPAEEEKKEEESAEEADEEPVPDAENGEIAVPVELLAPAEDPEEEKKKPRITLVNKPGMPEWTDEQAKMMQEMNPHAEVVIAEERKITRPLQYDGFTVTAVGGKYGTYQRVREFIDFNTDTESLSMTIDEWREFIAELKRAAAILGVWLED